MTVGEGGIRVPLLISGPGVKGGRQVDANDLVGGEMQNGKWMRQGGFKAVSVAPPYGTGNWHLYDVVKDPGEMRDLSKYRGRSIKKS